MMFGADIYDAGQDALNEAKSLKNEVRWIRKKIRELEDELAEIKERHNRLDIAKEVKKMMELKEGYIPPKFTHFNCDFTRVGGTLICTRCHNEFESADFIPSFCPFCFAERNKEGGDDLSQNEECLPRQ